jgi:hypothetical protein
VVCFRRVDIAIAFDQVQQYGMAFDADPHPVARLHGYDAWMAFFVILTSMRLHSCGHAERLATGSLIRCRR